MEINQPKKFLNQINQILFPFYWGKIKLTLNKLILEIILEVQERNAKEQLEVGNDKEIPF
jgi:hypothetical protein